MDERALFETFKIAIEREREAYDFYLKAANEAPDVTARRLFQELADIESGHEKRLEELYAKLKSRSSA